MTFNFMLSGCGTKSNPTGKGLENEKLTIAWMGIARYPTGQEGAYPEKLLEERFNIELKPIFLDQSGYKTKKPIMMASGEIPDMIYEADPADVQQDLNQGTIIEVPYETIEKYAPTVFKTISDREPKAWLYSWVKGKNYGVPNLDYSGVEPRISMWRLDWLENVGIKKVPETLDEMHEAFMRFANNDPDGNGKKDTFGMSGDIKNWHIAFTEIFGAYGVMPFDWMKRDGKVVYGGLQPETKEALKLLADWYKEGIIHPDFIVDDVFKSGNEKFINGVVGYINSNGGIMNERNPSSNISVMKKLNLNAKIANGSPVRGKEDKAGKFVWGEAAHVIAFGRQVKEQPEKLKKVLEILEALATDEELAVHVRWGEKGKHWKYRDDNLGAYGGMDFISPYDDSKQADKELLTHGGMSTLAYYAPFPPKYEVYQKSLEKDKAELLNTFANPKYAMTDYFLKPDTLPSAGMLLTDIRSKQLRIMAQIIRGEKDISGYSEFEDFWNSQGGKTLEKEAAELDQNFQNLMNDIKSKK